jgi:hypothetical protein
MRDRSSSISMLSSPIRCMAKGGRPAKNPSSGTRDSLQRPLRDLGITYDQSSNWQKLAAVPEKDFQRSLPKPPGSGTASDLVPERTQQLQRRMVALRRLLHLAHDTDADPEHVRNIDDARSRCQRAPDGSLTIRRDGWAHECPSPLAQPPLGLGLKHESRGVNRQRPCTGCGEKPADADRTWTGPDPELGHAGQHARGACVAKGRAVRPLCA